MEPRSVRDRVPALRTPFVELLNLVGGRQADQSTLLGRVLTDLSLDAEALLGGLLRHPQRRTDRLPAPAGGPCRRDGRQVERPGLSVGAARQHDEIEMGLWIGVETAPDRGVDLCDRLRQQIGKIVRSAFTIWGDHAVNCMLTHQTASTRC